MGHAPADDPLADGAVRAFRVPALAHLSVFDGVLVGLGPLQLREGAARG